MVNIYDLEAKAKKDLIEFNKEMSDKYDQLKKERDFDFFKKKQELMQNNTYMLWKLKDEYLNKQHKMQLQKMELVYRMKEGKISIEDFNNNLMEIENAENTGNN